MAEIVFKKAVRKAVPMLMGIVGPSGTGKTYSALRVASGMQKIMGGRIKVIDTEFDRALQYSDYFDFDHFPFRPPYSSLRYREILQAAAKIPGPTVVDSMSHEHEGEGGYIDLHDQEVKRLIERGGFRNEYAANVPAWGVPSKHRQMLINTIVTSGITAIFCFRSKEKVDMSKKDDEGKTKVGNLGWMPIAGDTFIYEMQVKALLLPGANGIPEWNPEFPGERAATKIPIYLQKVFEGTGQLNEKIGEHLATWAAGSKVITPEDKERFEELKGLYPLCSSAEGFANLEERRKKLWPTIESGMQRVLKTASDEALKRTGAVRLDAPASPPPPPTTTTPSDHVVGVGDPMYDEVAR